VILGGISCTRRWVKPREKPKRLEKPLTKQEQRKKKKKDPQEEEEGRREPIAAKLEKGGETSVFV